MVVSVARPSPPPGDADCEYNDVDSNEGSHGPTDGSEFLGMDFDLDDDFDLEALEAQASDVFTDDLTVADSRGATITITIDDWARLELDESAAGT